MTEQTEAKSSVYSMGLSGFCGPPIRAIGLEVSKSRDVDREIKNKRTFEIRSDLYLL